MTMSKPHEVDLCSSDSDDIEAPPQWAGKQERFRGPLSNTIEIDDDDEDDRKPTSSWVHHQSRLNRKRRRQDVIDLCFAVTSPVQERSAAALRPRVVEMIEQPKTLQERVLEVFPDVASDYLEKLRRDCKDSIDMMMSILSEGSYPKSKADGASPKFRAPASVTITRSKVMPMYDYTSTSSFQPTQVYIEEAVDMLLFEFPFIRVDSMRRFLKEHKQHFTPVRNQILDALKQDKSRNKKTNDPEIQQYLSLKTVWATKRPSIDQMECIGRRNCMKRFIRRPLPTLTDPILKDEVQHAQDQLETWMEAMDEKQKRQEARMRSELSGNGMECGCCFGKVPFEEMVACRNEGHLFCTDCIQRYADTQIFSNGSLGVIKATSKQSCELLCCDASGCQSGFYEEHLQRTLNVKTLERYTELQFRASIEAAGLSEEICSCPKCGFQADLPLNLIIFQCPVDDCGYESCRKCGKEPHIPLHCDEVVQKSREDEGRLKVEEALAQAKIRKCPKCATSFVKSEGCNKMMCRCGTAVCYICRKELKGKNPYEHFCQVPLCDHKSCKKCILFSNAEEDDQRAMREAGLTAAQTFRKELQEKGASSLEVNIDVDRIMTTGVAVARRQVAARR